MARVPFTGRGNGFQSAMACSQPGANVSCSRMPDSSSTGWATVFISGASASSDLTTTATP